MATKASMKLLFVEDDIPLRSNLATLLAPVFRIEYASTLREAESLCESTYFDLALVDLSLPDGNGNTLCQRRHFLNPNLPIIVVTAAFDTTTRTQLLKEGADDYVTKPFCPHELQARINAVLRRSLPAPAPGSVVFDRTSRVLTYHAKSLALTRIEFEILEKLYSKAGQVVPFGEILDSVWENDHQPFSNALNVHLGHLRQKLAGAGIAITLTCHRSLGVQLISQEG